MSLPLAGNIGDQDEVERTAETTDEEQSPDATMGVSFAIRHVLFWAANLQAQKSGQRSLTPSEGDGLDLLDTILDILTGDIRFIALLIGSVSTSSGLLVVVRASLGDGVWRLIDLLLMRSQSLGNGSIVLSGKTLADLVEGRHCCC